MNASRSPRKAKKGIIWLTRPALRRDVAFLRRRLRSVPSLPPPRFALGLAFVKSGLPRLYAPPSRSRTDTRRQGLPRRLFFSANPSFSWPDEQQEQVGAKYKGLASIISFEKGPALPITSRLMIDVQLTVFPFQGESDAEDTVPKIASHAVGGQQVLPSYTHDRFSGSSCSNPTPRTLPSRDGMASPVVLKDPIEEGHLSDQVSERPCRW